MTPTLETLLPCPFCGGYAEIYTEQNKWWNVSCSTEECRGGSDEVLYISKEYAIKLWNTRSDIHAAKVKELESLLDEIYTSPHKMACQKDNKELRIENSTLRAQLEAAENMAKALNSAAVDFRMVGLENFALSAEYAAAAFNKIREGKL